MNPVGGRGAWGWGRGGGGWGRRNWFYATGLTGWQRAAMGYPGFGGAVPAYPAGYPAPASTEQQLDALKAQAQYFEDALDGIRKRIEELQAAGKKD
jgi:hypothetical protein